MNGPSVGNPSNKVRSIGRLRERNSFLSYLRFLKSKTDLATGIMKAKVCMSWIEAWCKDAL